MTSFVTHCSSRSSVHLTVVAAVSEVARAVVAGTPVVARVAARRGQDRARRDPVRAVDADLPEIGTFFTVNGLVPDPTRQLTATSLPYAERYLWHGEATTPRMAEDLAREEVREKGLAGGFDHLRLYVTGVFEGKLPNVDKYARFLDPEIIGED